MGGLLISMFCHRVALNFPMQEKYFLLGRGVFAWVGGVFTSNALMNRCWLCLWANYSFFAYSRHPGRLNGWCCWPFAQIRLLDTPVHPLTTPSPSAGLNAGTKSLISSPPISILRGNHRANLTGSSLPSFVHLLTTVSTVISTVISTV